MDKSGPSVINLAGLSSLMNQKDVLESIDLTSDKGSHSRAPSMRNSTSSFSDLAYSRARSASRQGASSSSASPIVEGTSLAPNRATSKHSAHNLILPSKYSLSPNTAEGLGVQLKDRRPPRDRAVSNPQPALNKPKTSSTAPATSAPKHSTSNEPPEPIILPMSGLPDSQDVVPAGMEKGYAMSKIAELRLRYNDNSTEYGSIFYLSKIFANKENLEAEDILDRGVSKSYPRPRFTLADTISTMLKATIEGLQGLLNEATDLMERGKAFQVDPLGFLFSTLNGCSTLAELHTAWRAIRERVGLAQRFMEKYDAEFQSGIKLLSPASTNQDIYEKMAKEPDNRIRLYQLMANVPHHYGLFDAEVMGKIHQGDDLENHVPVPPSLTQAFPHRFMEDKPKVIYYDASGARQERFSPPRSSYGVGPGFKVPQDDSYVTKDRPGVAGKKVSIDPVTRQLQSDDSSSAGKYVPPARRNRATNSPARKLSGDRDTPFPRTPSAVPPATPLSYPKYVLG